MYAVEVTLFYKNLRAGERGRTMEPDESTEKGEITLNKYASANLYFPGKDFYLTHYNGTWEVK
ncbi:hypothetical protein [Dyadobacter sp. OTU695]|uniref:hypothetical protein n=1 Tax=Dyadobacter sp. OTU695 TaxID=3043860 RepID=UPI00313BEBA5